MRTRWLVVLLGASLAVNAALGAALWVSWHGAGTMTLAARSVCSAPLCDEEMRLREELAAALCAATPDRAAIAAVLARLDEVRAGQRATIVDRWLARCSGAGAGERSELAATVTRVLCPWHAGTGAPSCAPTPAPGTPQDAKPPHGQS